MSSTTPGKWERIGRAVGAWSCVLGGVVLAATVALVPTWRDVGRLEAQRQVLAAQARDLQWQQQSYEQMRDALFTDDPVVLEYLAYHYLGLKPMDAGLVRESAGSQDARFVSVEHSLHRPLSGIEGRAYKAAGQRSRLGQVARAVVRVSQRALESWCGGEAELAGSGALTDERVRAITSLALSGEPPFAP